jgi:hypothetical protein
LYRAAIIAVVLLLIAVPLFGSYHARLRARRFFYKLTGLGKNPDLLEDELPPVLTEALEILDCAELSDERKELLRVRRHSALNREKCRRRAEPLYHALFQMTSFFTNLPFTFLHEAGEACWTINFCGRDNWVWHCCEVRPDSELFHVVEVTTDGTTVEYSGNLTAALARVIQIADAELLIPLDALRKLRG